MDLTTLQAVLTAIDVPADTAVFEPSIKQISLESNMNVFYSFLSHSLYFDTTNQLLLLKEHYYKLVSSKFKSAQRISAGNYTISPDEIGQYAVQETILLTKFRNPRVGDLAFTVSSSANTFVAAATITAIDLAAGTMTLSSDLSLTNNTLCYASGADLQIVAGSIVPIENGDTVQSLISRDSILILRRPLSSNLFDEVVSTTAIESIMLNRYTNDSSLFVR
jgi:hypothetical protein